MNDIAVMLKMRDWRGLMEVLRQQGDPMRRMAAAAALGHLSETQSVEYLVRSVRQDPDPRVQEAAREALYAVVGQDAQLVLDSYRGGTWDDPWLLDEPEDAEPVSRFSLDVPDEDVDDLAANGDWDQLVALLRKASDPEGRVAAAEALGKLGEPETVESLARAVLQDPDFAVQEAAADALWKLTGRHQYELVLSSYRGVVWDDDPWLREEDEGAEQVDIAAEMQLSGLVAVAGGDGNAETRQRAIGLLKEQLHDMRVIALLAQIARADSDKTVRAAAHAALQEKFADDIDTILQAYGEEVIDEDDEDEEETGLYEEKTRQKDAPVGLYVQSPVIKEESSIPGGWALILLIVCAVAAVILFAWR